MSNKGGPPDDEAATRMMSPMEDDDDAATRMMRPMDYDPQDAATRVVGAMGDDLSEGPTRVVTQLDDDELQDARTVVASSDMLKRAAGVSQVGRPEPRKKPGGTAAIIGLILAIASAGGMGFVLFEPVAAYRALEKELSSGEAIVGGPADTAERMTWRAKEASWPLAGSTLVVVIALVMTFVGRRKGGLALAGWIVGGLALASAAYVWISYGGPISAQLF